ncbi:MAG: hypothetical protein AB7S38_32375 [Vulcanimicrobiota bacterium]
MGDESELPSLKEPDLYPAAGWGALGALYLVFFLFPPLGPAMGGFVLLLDVALAFCLAAFSLFDSRRRPGAPTVGYWIVVLLLPLQVAGLGSTLKAPDDFGNPWPWVAAIPTPLLGLTAMLALFLSVTVGLWSLAIVKRSNDLFYAEDLSLGMASFTLTRDFDSWIHLAARRRDLTRSKTASYLLFQNSILMILAAWLGSMLVDTDVLAGVVAQNTCVACAANALFNLALAFLTGANPDFYGEA